MKILICGFMGSGKSTFVSRLSKTSDQFMVHDLDLEVASHLNIRANELGDYIRRVGMPEFRKLEVEILTSILENRTNSLVALGGGTVEAPGFWESIAGAKLVYLEETFECCYERITGDSNRPLAQKTKEELKDLYNLRHSLYSKSNLVLTKEKIKEIDSIEALVHNLSAD